MTEFSAIMTAQGYKETDKLRCDLYKAIFMQRPLRSQKHLVGYCPLEPSNPRAQISHPLFEEFRMLSFVNNLTLEDENGVGKDADGNLLYPLTPSDRELICSAFMKDSLTFKFSAITKLFKKDLRFKGKKLRFHYYHDDDSVASCSMRHKIKSAFGDVPYDEQKVFDALTFFDDNDKLRGWFVCHFPLLSDSAIDKLVKIHPKEGNANYSLKAIKKILPFLRKGYELSQARFFAKLPDVIADFDKHEDSIIGALKELAWQSRYDRKAYAELDASVRKIWPQPLTLEERYRKYLLENWNVTEDKWNRLYSKGDSKYSPETEYKHNGKTVKLEVPRLPPVELGMIRNPLVQRSMTTLRRLVNYLGEHGKIDFSDTIRIELARSVNDFATRKAWQVWQEGRRKLREEAAVEIGKLGVAVTEDALERYVLWKEQGGICLYTGRSIKLSELLSGNAFDVEHTIPRSLSGDDSLANKTVCEAKYNRKIKKGRVPRDCPNWDQIDVMLGEWRKNVERLEKDCRNQFKKAAARTEPGERSKARVKALTTRFELNYWRDKVRRFDIESAKLSQPGDGLGGFKKRQLVDTGIMSTHAVELLKCLYTKTYAVNGAATAFARKAWGIQGDEGKDRTEHTHHAKDAMVIAALTPARFTAICAALKDDASEYRRECDVCPKPYAGFSENVRKACDEILVKHILRQTTLRQSSKRNALAHSHREKGDPNGRVIKFVKSQGDTVRGQLHKEFFYGCICRPGETGRIFVKRMEIAGKTVDDVLKFVDNIVDPVIRKIVTNRLVELKDLGIKDVAPGSITMASGVPINKARVKVRLSDPMVIRTHSHLSRSEYKNFIYAETGQGANFRLALFSDHNGYAAVPENALLWSKDHKKIGYEPLDVKPGFMGYVYPGSMTLALQYEGEDVSKCSIFELRKRLYTILSVGSEKEKRAEFRNALLAGQKKMLGKPVSIFSKDLPPNLLRMGPAKYLSQMLFEGIHFKMMLDGTIKFIER
jgi:CRISPR-associated endonuclease Csn1